MTSTAIDKNDASLTNNPKADIDAALATLDPCNHEHKVVLREVNFNNLIAHLEAAGVASVDVDFDGCGDSGSIEEASCFDANETPMTLTDSPIEMDLLVVDHGHFDSTSQKWVSEIVRKTLPLAQALDDFIEDEVEGTGINWYDNDGGFGYWRLNVAERLLDFEINVRYTESNCEHSADEVPELEMVAEQANNLGISALLKPALSRSAKTKEAREEAERAAKELSSQNATIREAYSKAAKPAIQL